MPVSLLATLIATSVTADLLPLDVLTYQFFGPATGALCLDGSIGGYAGRNGSETQLVLHLPGGGWCETEGECAARASTSLGSTTELLKGGNTTIVQGEMSANATLNPHFYTWTHVEPIYCDGSNFAGAQDHPGMPGALYNGTLHVRGRQILTSVLDVILDDWGLKHTLEEVILSGCSAGGLGVYYNADFVHTYVQSKLAHGKALKMRAFGNAGWFLDLNSPGWDGPAWSSTRPRGMLLYAWAGLQQTLNSDCITTYKATGETWRCALAQYLYPFVETPTLALQSSYDLNQLANSGLKCLQGAAAGFGRLPNGQYGPKSLFPHSFPNCTEVEIREIDVYGDTLKASLSTARRGAAFVPTCTIHCYTAFWTQIKIDDVTMADAIYAFYSAANPNGMVWQDTCRGGNCNPTCPVAVTSE